MRRFFCQNCGEEVREHDDLCRSCGAIFVAIQCPQCGFRGKQHRFRDGCPECGYLGSRSGTMDSDRQSGIPYGASADRRVRYASGRKPMPGWVFWMILGVLTLSFIVLALVYARV